MKNKIFIISQIVFVITIFFKFENVAAQQTAQSLDDLVEQALKNNKLYFIKSVQVEEKIAKVKEDKIKLYPALSVSSTYQYNANIGQLAIPQGAFGTLPLPTGSIALPNNELFFDLGKHQTFNVGATVYQPISQLSKIKTGLEVGKVDVEVANREKVKAALQIRQAIEKLYYGILIVDKQKEEAEAKLALAKMRFFDVESAKLSGKTIQPNESGLQANIADEEQTVLKLDIQREDYLVDLSRLTGLKSDTIRLENLSLKPKDTIGTLDEYQTGALNNNVDIQLADLNKRKSELAIKAAKLSYRPDIGIFAGYTFQKGSVIFPQNNPFIGASLKWNIQDIFSNKEVVKQRYLIAQQAETFLSDKQEEINNQIEKSYRKIKQAQSLIQVAERAYMYRQQELKVQEDRKYAGLNTEADVLNTKSLLAKSEADLFAAQLGYRLAVSDLKILTEQFE